MDGMFVLILGGAIGAALMYFLDPNGGARRRNVTRERVTSLAGKGISSAGDTAQRMAGSAQGVVRESVPIKHDNPDPDDTTLKDRIESELFRDPKLGRDKINITVVDGVVELRGELPTKADIDKVVGEVKAIRNVDGVANYLHTPGTPAPNKEEALEVS